MIFGSLEPVKSRIRKCAKFGDLGLVKTWGHEHAEAQCLELSVAQTSEDGQFGNLSRVEFGVRGRGHARTSEEMKTSSGIY
jgi:hypothetical protein